MLSSVGIDHVLFVAVGDCSVFQSAAVAVVDHGVAVLVVLDPHCEQLFAATLFKGDGIVCQELNLAVLFGSPADEIVVLTDEGVLVNVDGVGLQVSLSSVLCVSLGDGEQAVAFVVGHRVVILGVFLPLCVQDSSVVLCGQGDGCAELVAFAGAVSLGVPANEGVVFTDKSVDVGVDCVFSVIDTNDVLFVKLGLIVAEVGVVDHQVVVPIVLFPLCVQGEGVVLCGQYQDIFGSVSNAGAVSLGVPADEVVVLTGEGVFVNDKLAGGFVGILAALAVVIGLGAVDQLAAIAVISQSVIILGVLFPDSAQDHAAALGKLDHSAGIVINNDLSVFCDSLDFFNDCPTDEGVVFTGEVLVLVDFDVVGILIGFLDAFGIDLGNGVLVGIVDVDYFVVELLMLFPLCVQGDGDGLVFSAGGQCQDILCGVSNAGAVSLGVPADEVVVLTREGVFVDLDSMGGSVGFSNILIVAVGQYVASRAAVAVVVHGEGVLVVLDPYCVQIQGVVAFSCQVQGCAFSIDHSALGRGCPANEIVMLALETSVSGHGLGGLVNIGNILAICLGSGACAFVVGVISNSVVVLLVLLPLCIQGEVVVILGQIYNLILCVGIAIGILPADEGVVLTREGVFVDLDSAVGSFVGAGDVLAVAVELSAAHRAAVAEIDNGVVILGIFFPLCVQSDGVVGSGQLHGSAGSVSGTLAVSLGVPANEVVMLKCEGVFVYGKGLDGIIDILCSSILVVANQDQAVDRTAVAFILHRVAVSRILGPGTNQNHILTGHLELTALDGGIGSGPAGEGVVIHRGSCSNSHFSILLNGCGAGNCGSAGGNSAFICVGNGEVRQLTGNTGNVEGYSYGAILSCGSEVSIAIGGVILIFLEAIAVGVQGDGVSHGVGVSGSITIYNLLSLFGIQSPLQGIAAGSDIGIIDSAQDDVFAHGVSNLGAGAVHAFHSGIGNVSKGDVDIVCIGTCVHIGHEHILQVLCVSTEANDVEIALASDLFGHVLSVIGACGRSAGAARTFAVANGTGAGAVVAVGVCVTVSQHNSELGLLINVGHSAHAPTVAGQHQASLHIGGVVELAQVPDVVLDCSHASLGLDVDPVAKGFCAQTELNDRDPDLAGVGSCQGIQEASVTGEDALQRGHAGSVTSLFAIGNATRALSAVFHGSRSVDNQLDRCGAFHNSLGSLHSQGDIELVDAPVRLCHRLADGETILGTGSFFGGGVSNDSVLGNIESFHNGVLLAFNCEDGQMHGAEAHDQCQQHCQGSLAKDFRCHISFSFQSRDRNIDGRSDMAPGRALASSLCVLPFRTVCHFRIFLLAWFTLFLQL